MENNQPIGYLFESVPYFSEESVSLMIESLSKKQISYLLSQSLNYAHSKNIFTLTESEIVSKCLRILNKEMFSYDDNTGEKSDNVENN